MRTKYGIIPTHAALGPGLVILCLIAVTIAPGTGDHRAPSVAERAIACSPYSRASYGHSSERCVGSSTSSVVSARKRGGNAANRRLTDPLRTPSKASGRVLAAVTGLTRAASWSAWPPAQDRPRGVPPSAPPERCRRQARRRSTMTSEKTTTAISGGPLRGCARRRCHVPDHPTQRPRKRDLSERGGEVAKRAQSGPVRPRVTPASGSTKPRDVRGKQLSAHERFEAGKEAIAKRSGSGPLGPWLR